MRSVLNINLKISKDLKAFCAKIIFPDITVCKITKRNENATPIPYYTLETSLSLNQFALVLLGKHLPRRLYAFVLTKWRLAARDRNKKTITHKGGRVACA